jgi:hypothetical protein
MASVEDCEILLLLTHVRHAEVSTHSVRKQLRVIRLLCALDIPHAGVDLRLGRVSSSFVRGILCSEDLRLIHRMKIAIQCRGGDPLIC